MKLYWGLLAVGMNLCGSIWQRPLLRGMPSGFGGFSAMEHVSPLRFSPPRFNQPVYPWLNRLQFGVLPTVQKTYDWGRDQGGSRGRSYAGYVVGGFLTLGFAAAWLVSHEHKNRLRTLLNEARDRILSDKLSELLGCKLTVQSSSIDLLQGTILLHNVRAESRMPDAWSWNAPSIVIRVTDLPSSGMHERVLSGVCDVTISGLKVASTSSYGNIALVPYLYELIYPSEKVKSSTASRVQLALGALAIKDGSCVLDDTALDTKARLNFDLAVKPDEKNSWKARVTLQDGDVSVLGIQQLSHVTGDVTVTTEGATKIAIEGFGVIAPLGPLAQCKISGVYTDGNNKLTITAPVNTRPSLSLEVTHGKQFDAIFKDPIRVHARLPFDDFKKIVASESRQFHGGTALLSFTIDPMTLWQTLRTDLTLQGVQYGWLLRLPTLHLQGTGVKALLENDFDVLLPGGIALRGWLSTAQKPALPEEFV